MAGEPGRDHVGMAVLRMLAVGLLAAVLGVPVLWLQRGDGFEHVRFAALTALSLGQFVTVPIGMVVGVVLGVRGKWSRTPGYVLGGVTVAFGVLVVQQATSAMRWVDTRPSGFGDPDAEAVMMGLAWLSGAVTVLVGIAVVLFRWAGYDSRTAPVRERRRRRPRPSRL